MTKRKSPKFSNCFEVDVKGCCGHQSVYHEVADEALPKEIVSPTSVRHPSASSSLKPCERDSEVDYFRIHDKRLHHVKSRE